MKTIVLIFAFFVLFFNLKSQDSIALLKINRFYGAINSNGFLFDSSNNSGLLNLSNTNFSSGVGVWMSANDNTGILRVSAHDVINKKHEFWQGPLALSTNVSANPTDWNKVYPINKTEVDEHKKNFNKSNYFITNNLLNWPGSSNPPYAKILAPFVDYQVNDQIYSPKQGDYPFFKGDGLIYSIANDNYEDHLYSNAQALGVELHTMIYGFSSNDSFLNKTILVKFLVFNRSNQNYSNFRFSNVINFNIGSEINEFLGTDVKNKVLFSYNDTSQATFSKKLVSLGCMAINKPISSTMYFNNDNDNINGVPTNAQHFQNYMQGKWKNNSNLNYGSNGVDGSGLAKFIYPFDTDDNNNNLMWNEESVGNTSGKRIGLINFEPEVLNSNSALEYEMAYFFVEDSFKTIKQISDFCLNLNQSLAKEKILQNTSNLTSKESFVQIYPNPLKNSGQLCFTETSLKSSAYKIYNSIGVCVAEFNLEENENCVKLPHNLEAGFYWVIDNNLNRNKNFKLIIE